MFRAYISAPYTSKAEKKKERPYGRIKDRNYIKFLEKLTRIIREHNFSVILPHKYVYEWGGTDFRLDSVIRKAFDTLSTCDLLVAYPEKSKGVNVVIGWASVLRKKIVILLREGEEESIVYKGLKGLTETTILTFKNMNELEIKLKKYLEKNFPI